MYSFPSLCSLTDTIINTSTQVWGLCLGEVAVSERNSLSFLCEVSNVNVLLVLHVMVNR